MQEQPDDEIGAFAIQRHAFQSRAADATAAARAGTPPHGSVAAVPSTVASPSLNPTAASTFFLDAEGEELFPASTPGRAGSLSDASVSSTQDKEAANMPTSPGSASSAGARLRQRSSLQLRPVTSASFLPPPLGLARVQPDDPPTAVLTMPAHNNPDDGSKVRRGSNYMVLTSATQDVSVSVPMSPTTPIQLSNSTPHTSQPQQTTLNHTLPPLSSSAPQQRIVSMASPRHDLAALQASAVLPAFQQPQSAPANKGSIGTAPIVTLPSLSIASSHAKPVAPLMSPPARAAPVIPASPQPSQQQNTVASQLKQAQMGMQQQTQAHVHVQVVATSQPSTPAPQQHDLNPFASKPQ